MNPLEYPPCELRGTPDKKAFPLHHGEGLLRHAWREAKVHGHAAQVMAAVKSL